ncbi:MAG: zinc ribbon domain-containing protein [Pelolinea sp.]|nr:zinc ribbon domain-containing protein [Pelolinea sp.]
MKNSWKWLIVFGVVFIAVLFIALLIFPGSGYGWMPMMGNRGFSNINGFGVIGGIVMMLAFLFIPVVLIGLAVFGVVVLMQRSRNIMPQPQSQSLSCSHCGKPIQADWKVCPHCGNKI